MNQAESTAACQQLDRVTLPYPTYRELRVIEGGGRQGDGAPSPSLTASRRVTRATSLNARQEAIALVTLLAVVALIFSAGMQSLRSVDSSLLRALAEIPSQTVTVSEGQSVWSLAGSHPVEGRSTCEVVTWIEEANHLDSAMLVPGQELVVPA